MMHTLLLTNFFHLVHISGSRSVFLRDRKETETETERQRQRDRDRDRQTEESVSPWILSVSSTHFTHPTYPPSLETTTETHLDELALVLTLALTLSPPRASLLDSLSTQSSPSKALLLYHFFPIILFPLPIVSLCLKTELWGVLQEGVVFQKPEWFLCKIVGN